MSSGSNVRRRRDDGVSMPELIVVVAMLGLVVAALSGAIIVFLRNSDDLTEKLEASQTALLATRYLPSDLQSAENGGVTTSGFVAVCGVSPDVLSLTWTDFATDPSIRYDSLYHVSGDDLVRTLCADGAQVQTRTVAQNVASATATLTGNRIELTITTQGTAADPTGFTYSVHAMQRT